jgi:hypothetical protein
MISFITPERSAHLVVVQLAVKRVELVVITLTGILKGILLISGYVGFHNFDGIILS